MSTNQPPPKSIMVHLSVQDALNPINLMFRSLDERIRVFRYRPEILTVKRTPWWKRAFRKRPAPQILPEAIVAAHDLISGMYIPGDSVCLFIDSLDQSVLSALSILVTALATGTPLASSHPTTPSNDTPKMLQKIPTKLIVATRDLCSTTVGASDPILWCRDLHSRLPVARHTFTVGYDSASQVLGLYSLRNSKGLMEKNEVWNIETEPGTLGGFNPAISMSNNWLTYKTDPIINYDPLCWAGGSIFLTDPTWTHIVDPSHVLDYGSMTAPSPSFVANRYHLCGYETTHMWYGKCKWLKWSAIYD